MMKLHCCETRASPFLSNSRKYTPSEWQKSQNTTMMAYRYVYIYCLTFKYQKCWYLCCCNTICWFHKNQSLLRSKSRTQLFSEHEITRLYKSCISHNPILWYYKLPMSNFFQNSNDNAETCLCNSAWKTAKDKKHNPWSTFWKNKNTTCNTLQNKSH